MTPEVFQVVVIGLLAWVAFILTVFTCVLVWSARVGGF